MTSATWNRGLKAVARRHPGDGASPMVFGGSHQVPGGQVHVWGGIGPRSRPCQQPRGARGHPGPPRAELRGRPNPWCRAHRWGPAGSSARLGSHGKGQLVVLAWGVGAQPAYRGQRTRVTMAGGRWVAGSVARGCVEGASHQQRLLHPGEEPAPRDQVLLPTVPRHMVPEPELVRRGVRHRVEPL